MSKKRILIIDDDPMIRDILTAMLDAEGYEIIAAENGLKGLEILESEPKPINLSLIILDVMMPGMNGLDVLTRLKLKSETQNLPVIMLTGEDKSDDIMAGYTTGADFYITKPFTREQLKYGLNLVLSEGE